MKYIFVTGTDTNCGKTYTVCQLLQYMASCNKKAIGLKPIASGCSMQHGGIINSDIELIKLYNYMPVTVGLWQFLPPIAPHIAAQKVNQEITLQSLVDFCCNEDFQNLDYVIIEGAGGLMVPINIQETWLDFIVSISNHIDIETLLVVGMRLGCINHALLTDKILQINQIKVKGWMANCLDPNMLGCDDNIQALKNMMHMPYLTTMFYKNDSNLFISL